METLLPGATREVRKVNSGFAIIPVNAEYRKKILEDAIRIKAFFGETIEENKKWYTYIIR